MKDNKYLNSAVVVIILINYKIIRTKSINLSQFPKINRLKITVNGYNSSQYTCAIWDQTVHPAPPL